MFHCSPALFEAFSIFYFNIIFFQEKFSGLFFSEYNLISKASFKPGLENQSVKRVHRDSRTGKTLILLSLNIAKTSGGFHISHLPP